ncbi:MAG: Nif3-like dinuclear metal center hexameric protein [Burkholderiaceae bacterium]|nr:MAG: Nif3-like dinuclear metal center hexameric protein [Burkholderiaceae bacterium]
MVNRRELEAYLQELLGVERWKDYGPNGVQVEGQDEISRLAVGVTASRAFIEAALAQGAQALLVHHGLFWRGYEGRITGWMKQRIAPLIHADATLLAYHLPLDAHPEFGNNAALAAELGWTAQGQFGEQQLGCWGVLPEAQSLAGVVERVQARLGRACTAVAGDGRPIRKVAWCTGGAQSYFEGAIAAGADLYLTGEISEPQAHYARETGVAYIAAGHHATERYGVQALGRHLSGRFGLTCTFIDIDNPA